MNAELFSVSELTTTSNNVVAITSCNNTIVIADDRNQISQYSLSYAANESGTLSPTLSSTDTRTRAKAKVLQLEYSSKTEHLILLDDKIRVLDHRSLELLYKIPHTRYASSFALDPLDSSRILVCIRKKLSLYIMGSTPPHQPVHEFSLVDVPTTLFLLGGSVFFHLNSKFFMVDLSDSTYSPIEMFPSASNVLTFFGQKTMEVFLPTDELGCFLSSTGEAVTAPLLLPRKPVVSCACSFPFLVTSTNDSLNVWLPSFESGSPLQSIPVSFIPKFMTPIYDRQSKTSSSKSIVIYDGSKKVFIIHPFSFKRQVSNFIKKDPLQSSKLFEFLRTLDCISSKESSELSRDFLRLYLTQEYPDSIEIVKKYFKSDHLNPFDYTDLVLDYLPTTELLKSFSRDVITGIDDAKITEEETISLRVLSFLQNQAKLGSNGGKIIPNEESVTIFVDFLLSKLRNSDSTSQIIHMALQVFLFSVSLYICPVNNEILTKLTEYIHTSKILVPIQIMMYFSTGVGPCLLLGQYFYQRGCILDSMVRLTKAANESKELWVKDIAASWICEGLEANGDSLTNFNEISPYLSWVLKSFPNKLISTLTKLNATTLSNWGIDTLLEFLKGCSLGIIDILEHLIKSSECSHQYHTYLGKVYITEISTLFKNYNIETVCQLQQCSSALLKSLMKRFSTFLSSSLFRYDYQEIISLLVSPAFLHEKVAVFSRAGFHQEALELLAKLDSLETAEKYCSTHASSKSEQGVFLLMLLKFVLSSQPLSAVLSFLYRQKDLLSYEEIVSSLHDEWPLQELVPLLTSLLRSSTSTKHQSSMERSLREVQERKVMADLIAAHRRNVTINHDSRCSVCGDKLGNKIFALLPDNSAVHIKCTSDDSILKKT
ncbi:hypothetical protein P9112_008773 [Eukaryota sp. TZLM1-RC]